MLGAFFESFSPRNSNPWFPQSANEWIDSASMAPEPVIMAATVFVMAMPRLASKANMIDFTDEFWCDMGLFISFDFDSISFVAGKLTNFLSTI